MKILSENSPFKMLPIEMDAYQRLILDAIRITFEMIENDYEQLLIKLLFLSQNDTIKEKTSPVFGNAWAIIDHSSRLIKLFQKLPSESNHKILDNILPVNSLRNTIQHLNERIDESLIKNKSPFYGILVWHHKNLQTNELTPKILYSGINYGSNVTFKIPDISKSNTEINCISLQSVDKKKIISINLSELLQEIHSICKLNEEKIGEFFKAQGWLLCDWSKQKDIMVSLKSEK